MRKDMNKVLVERPRRRKADYAEAERRRNDLDGPMHLGMRAGFGRPWLNENLSPLRRYLRAQVGRPWNKVYSEIAAGIDRRNTVQQHVYQHIDDFIAMQVELDGERLVDLRRLGSRRYGEYATVTQELYVDPRTGLIRVNKQYRAWSRERAEDRRKSQAELDARRRIVDGDTQLHRLDDHWFLVEMAPLPEIRMTEVNVRGRLVPKRVADSRFDVVLKREMSRLHYHDRVERQEFYGSDEVYAASKRQMSNRELKRYGLL
jgi:hypothetical protein